MRIVDLRERTVPIASAIANAYIDFSKMTLSLVAIVTDVMREGKPVIGYGFNSNGRYGQGALIRERFRPRLIEADPASLVNDAGDNLDPHKIWAALFKNEKPGDPLDFELQAKLAEHYAKPMATGENLFSMQDARNLVRYGGMRRDRDWLQFDCALSYGLVEYLRTLDMLRSYGWSPNRCIPHGGHQMSLNIAAGLALGGNESYPDLFQPYGGFPDGVKVENSYITMPELPGIGFEGKSDLIKEMRSLAS